jgi:DNA-binding NarL/FixJ family response regulator
LEKKFTTVLADDVADLRSLVRVVLEDSGRFEIVGEAGDGVAAVDVVEREQPDVVLLDISMPRMDGLEALPLIRSASPHSAVVILSAFEARERERRASDLGARGYLEKDLAPDALVPALLELLDGEAS